MPSLNETFKPEREPFSDRPALRLDETRTPTGPIPFCNPTRAHFCHSAFDEKPKTASSNDSALSENPEEKGASNDSTRPEDEQRAAKVSILWRSRDNRKGRHALKVQKAKPGEDAPFLAPPPTNSYRVIGKQILRMFTYLPYWDISWLIAVIFTLGSAVWVMNAFFVWLPSVDPSTEFNNEILYGGGITAFIGAIIFFETGSILLFFEAINEKHSSCFGWALEELTGGESGARWRVRADRRNCSHHHQNKKNFVGKSSADVHAESKPEDEATKDGKTWQWFPSLESLKTHYLHELGFLAGMAQLFGATVFGISGFTALPGIQNHIHPQYALNLSYWIPQVIGGTGFIVSGSLYMLETQEVFYKPAFGVLGWHIAFWNWIGAWGFTLSGALGMAYGSSAAQYQAGCATFWGSWAFLIGSVLQWYEALQKNPVEVVD